MKYSARTDANQAEIVAALRAAGASVLLLHVVGHGCPDVAVGYQGENYLMEIKTEKGELTEDEVKFFQDWRGRVAAVRSVDEALHVIGATND